MQMTMKSFETLEQMAEWKASEMHEANLERGGVFYEGAKEDFNEEGSEIRAVEGAPNFYRVSNLAQELAWVKNTKIQRCPIRRAMVIYGDSGVIAQASL